MIKKITWIIPFLCFIGGYMVLRSYLHTPSIKAPSVVGLSLNNAFVALSAQNLNIRLLELKEDITLEEGTVINQIPAPGQLIKARQTIFLTVVKHPAQATTPLFCGKSYPEIEAIAKQHDIKVKIYDLENNGPSGICFGQTPSPDTPLDTKTVIVYQANTHQKLIIWPNFVGRQLADVLDFLEPYNLKPRIIHHSHAGTRITDQRPLAGSIIDLTQKPYVQLDIS